MASRAYVALVIACLDRRGAANYFQVCGAWRDAILLNSDYVSARCARQMLRALFETWKNAIEPCRDEGYKCLSPDGPPFSESPWPRRPSPV